MEFSICYIPEKRWSVNHKCAEAFQTSNYKTYFITLVAISRYFFNWNERKKWSWHCLHISACPIFGCMSQRNFGLSVLVHQVHHLMLHHTYSWQQVKIQKKVPALSLEKSFGLHLSRFPRGHISHEVILAVLKDLLLLMTLCSLGCSENVSDFKNVRKGRKRNSTFTRVLKNPTCRGVCGFSGI